MFDVTSRQLILPDDGRQERVRRRTVSRQAGDGAFYALITYWTFWRRRFRLNHLNSQLSILRSQASRIAVMRSSGASSSASCIERRDTARVTSDCIESNWLSFVVWSRVWKCQWCVSTKFRIRARNSVFKGHQTPGGGGRLPSWCVARLLTAFSTSQHRKFPVLGLR